MPPTTIGLCGRLAVEVGGVRREADLPGRQGRLALAYLALNHGRPVSREELVEAVWGDATGSSQGLNVVLSKLRRALGPGVVEGVRGESVQLAGGVEVDLAAAGAALEQVRGALSREQWAAVPEAARGIIALADRGLLVGLEAAWLDEARRDLEAMGLEARACLAEAELGIGEAAGLAGAERLARTLVERAPYRESGHVLLMRVLEAEGDVAEALRVYDRLRVLLREELGVAPSRRAQALLERLLRQEAAEAPAAAPPAASPPGLPFFATRSRAAFVGRRAELAGLRRHFERAVAGERQVVLLEGEPGIGKTRLAARLAAECHEAGAAVLYGRCDAETLIPYQPFLEAIRAHVGGLPRDDLRRRLGVHAAELARVLPELAGGTDAPATGAPGEGERYRLFEAVSAVLIELARARPVVLVLDDLHWADLPTLLMLRQAVRATEGAPLLLLASYRDTERGDALLDTLADLRREHFLERITLTGLEDEDAATLIRQLTGAELASGVGDALVQETMGNPFFLEEMVRSLAADAAQAPGGDGRPVPEGIREVVGRRLARLTERTRRLLGAAAVIGRTFGLDVLEAVAGLPEDELDESLEEAVAAQVVLEVPGQYGRFAFSHALIRQTLYDDLSATRRARMHGRVGEVLERLAGDDPAALSSLAHHFFRAPPASGLARACDYAERAARHADGQLAYEEAARLYGLALQGLTCGGADEPRRGRLLQAQGEAHVKAGATGAARAAFAAAHALASARGDAEAAARAALGHGTTAHMAGGVVDPTTIAMLESGLAALGDGDSPLRARLLARLAIELSFSGERARRAELSAAAVETARRLGDPACLGYTLVARHWCLWAPENVDERLATTEDLLRLAERSGEEKLARQGHRWRMMDLLELGDVEAVDAEIAAFARLAEERRRLSERIYLRLFGAMRALLAGRFDEVEPLARDALQLGRRVEDPNAGQAYVLQMLALRREQGRLEEMAGAVEENVARYPSIPGWRCVLAHLHAELDVRDAARRELDDLAAGGFAVLPLDGLWLGGIAFLAETAAALGDDRHAAALYERLLPYAGRNVVMGWASTCAGSAARHLGLLARLLGRRDAAAAHFEAALAFNARMGAEPWVARTELAYADLLLGSAEDERGRALLERARTRAAALGMRRVVEEAERLGARGGAVVG